jgi:hypothetical protein
MPLSLSLIRSLARRKLKEMNLIVVDNSGSSSERASFPLMSSQMETKRILL